MQPIEHGSTVANSRTSRLASSAWPGVLMVCIFALPIVIISQFIAHYEDTVVDDDLFAYFGWCIREGAVLYRDLWDHKPPGVFWLNAAGFLAGDTTGVFVIGVVTQLATLGLFITASYLLFHRGAAAILSAMAVVLLTHRHYFGGANRGETYVVSLELLLLVCCLLAMRRDRFVGWLVGGACGGAALLMKQTGFAALIAILLHQAILVWSGRIDRSAALRRVMFLLSGAAAVLAIAATVLAIQSTLGEAVRATLTANRDYIALGGDGPSDSSWWRERIERSGWPLLKLPILLAVGSLLHSVANLLHGPRRQAVSSTDECDMPMALISIWLVVSWAAALAGPMHSTHYMLPVLPPLLLLGGRILDLLFSEAAILQLAAQRAWIIVAILVFAYLASDAVSAQMQKASVVYWDRRPERVGVHLRVQPTAAEMIGRRIAECTVPDDTLICWDYLPKVALEARRRSATRFPSKLHFDIAVRSGIASDDEYLDALVQRVPAVIVIKSATRRVLEAAAENPSADDHTVVRHIFSSYALRPEWTRGDIELLTLATKPVNEREAKSAGGQTLSR